MINLYGYFDEHGRMIDAINNLANALTFNKGRYIAIITLGDKEAWEKFFYSDDYFDMNAKWKMIDKLTVNFAKEIL